MIIETSNLRLIPVSKKHGEEFLRLWSNIDVVKYTYNVLRNSTQECEDWIEIILKSLDVDKDTIPFTVFYNDKIIGFAGSPTRNYSKGEYGLFYQFDEEYWGNGYGYETAKGIINYNYTNQKLHILYK